VFSFGFNLKKYLHQLCQPHWNRDQEVVNLLTELVQTWKAIYNEDNHPTVNHHLVELFEKALLPYGDERYTLKLIAPDRVIEEQRVQLMLDTFKASGLPRISPFALTLDFTSFDLHLNFAVVVNFSADTSHLEPFFGDELTIISNYTAEGVWHWPPDDEFTLDRESDAWSRLIDQLKPTILQASPLVTASDWLPGTYRWCVYPVSETVPEAQMIRPHYIA
jgi:hypothetical protein